MAKNVVQTQGKGSANPQLQDCPPDYHFELTQEELFRAIENPQSLAQTLTASGIPGLDRIKSIVISFPEYGTKLRTPTTYCCVSCLSESVC